MSRFALKIALLNALAYIYPVVMATYIDSLIHHVVFGPRYYWMGYGVVLGSIFIFIFTYISNSTFITIIYSKIDYSARWRSLLTFLSLYVPILIVLVVNFGPEFPHMAISTNSLGYGLMIASIVYVHEYKANFSDINNEISQYIKVERLKLEYMTWLAVTIGLLISFIFFCLILYSVFPDLSKQYTIYPNEQVLLFNSFVLDLFLAIIFSIFAFIELFTRVQHFKNQLMYIKK
jgi:hypothetical protein